MNLEKKKRLTAKTLNVGKGRIIFNNERLSEIKEAITRQDIRDLHTNGAIAIKPISGRKTIVKRKTRRRHGSVKKKVNKGKENYVILTRKLRAYVREMRKHEEITQEQYNSLRKQIRASIFRSKSHLKEILMGAKK